MTQRLINTQNSTSTVSKIGYELKPGEHGLALTGHRPDKLGGYNIHTPTYRDLYRDLFAYILDYSRMIDVENNEKLVCHSGMALGADTIWTYTITSARKQIGNHIKFVAHIPCENHSSKWRAEDQKHWHELVEMADDEVIYGKEYHPSLMQKRNEGMVNASRVLLALWDGTSGGTANCVNYAHKKSVPVTILKPSNYFPPVN